MNFFLETCYFDARTTRKPAHQQGSFPFTLHPARYMNSAWLWMSTRDIYISLFKAAVFGGLMALVCSTRGYMTKGGAKEVGISTTRAAILSTIYMLVADFLINLVFYIF